MFEIISGFNDRRAPLKLHCDSFNVVPMKALLW